MCTILDILGIAFVILKVIGEISWGWFGVLSPFIASFILRLIIGLLKEWCFKVSNPTLYKVYKDNQYLFNMRK